MKIDNIMTLSYDKMLLWLAKKYLPEGSVRAVASPLLQGNTDEATNVFMKTLAKHWSVAEIDEAHVKAMYLILDAKPEQALQICMKANLL
jgi:hypothetical protein